MNYFTLFFLLFFFNSLIVAQSQDFTCNTPPLTQEQYAHLRDKVANIKFQKTNGINYVPIDVFIARYSDGSGGYSVEDVSRNIANLNHHFFGAGIEFYLTEISPIYIDNDEYVRMSEAERQYIVETYSKDPLNLKDAVKIFVFNNTSSKLFLTFP